MIWFSTVFSIVTQEQGSRGRDQCCVLLGVFAGNWVEDGFENGQDRGRKIVEELVGRVQNKSLKPRKRRGLGVIWCLERRGKSASHVSGSCLCEDRGISC